MVGTPKVTMTMRELDRLKCVQGVVDRQLKLYQAAERLGLTTRQVRRLVRRHEAAEPGADPPLEQAYRADEIPDNGNGREQH